MKKEFRVKRNEDFQTIITAGKSKANSVFVMYYLKAANQHDRIGISVGKKIGNAVVRNKVKRQVRMMLQQISDFHSGYDRIIIVRNRYHKNDYAKNKNELSLLYNSVYNKKDELKGD